MIETEAKIPVTGEEAEKIRKAFDFPGFVSQENKFYFIQNGFMRIRNERGLSFFTYKGVRKKGEYNIRDEIEIGVNNSENLEKILSYLGLKVDFCYAKRRTSLVINDCIVSLDSFDNGDFYIEIEGDAKNIKKNIISFGLSGKKIERRPYQEILQKNFL